MADTVDLNADLGEGFGDWRKGDDEALMSIVTSANIACGFHAGDPVTMARTLRLAKARGVGIGAHPGFDDLRSFGRRRILGMDAEELRSMIVYQIGALVGLARAEGTAVRHVKLHGALSNMACEDEALSRICVEAVQRLDPSLIFVATSATALERAAVTQKARYVSEVYADRAYMSDGTLAPRSQPGSVLHDPAEIADRVARMLQEREVISIQGKPVRLDPRTICVHGDNPEALGIAEKLRKRIEDEGFRFEPFGLPDPR